MLDVLLTLFTLAQPVEILAQKAKVEYCKTHLECAKLAEAVFFESRGEPIKGQYAVAHTVVTRAESTRWPDTVKAVVNQKINGRCQYSYMCQIELKRDRLKVMRKYKESWNTALSVAADVLFGFVSDPTNGADHFYNPKKVKRPVFARSYQFVARIGDHRFYRSTQCNQANQSKTYHCRSKI